jgi:hypothetical protein
VETETIWSLQICNFLLNACVGSISTCAAMKFIHDAGRMIVRAKLFDAAKTTL